MHMSASATKQLLRTTGEGERWSSCVLCVDVSVQMCCACADVLCVADVCVCVFCVAGIGRCLDTATHL